MNDHEPASVVEVFGEVAGTTLGKFIEAAVLISNPDPMLAASFGGVVQGTAKSLITAGAGRLSARRRRKVQLALEEARKKSGGMAPEKLLARALDRDDDKAFELFMSAMHAASREADEERVRFYGRIAASGA